MTNSAAAWADQAADDRKRHGGRWLCAARLLGFTSAPLAAVGLTADIQPAAVAAALLAASAAACAWIAHRLRAPGAAEIRRRMGSIGETATRLLTTQLTAQGWHAFHDRAEPGRGGNIDHLLLAPTVRFLAVTDSKRWRADATVMAGTGGRLLCGREDRTAQADKLLELTSRVHRQVGNRIPGLSLAPVLAIHGAVVRSGWFKLERPGGPVYVAGDGALVPLLSQLADVQGKQPNPAAAHRAASLLRQIYPPYRQAVRQEVRRQAWESARTACRSGARRALAGAVRCCRRV